MTKTAQPGTMMLSDLDVALTHGINGWAGQLPLIDRLMIWISAIGVPLLVAAVALQWWQGNNKPHTRHILLATGFSFLLGLAINQLILLFVQRARPYDAGVTHLLIERSADFSFPSDHATATAAIAAAFLIHGMPRRGALFLAAAMLMVFSRVYVGTHYASDVLGGALTADTDEAGHAFQYEAGHLFQSEAGRRSDLMSATGVALLQIGLNDVSRFERGQAGSFFVAAERRLRRLSPESSIR